MPVGSSGHSGLGFSGWHSQQPVRGLDAKSVGRLDLRRAVSDLPFSPISEFEQRRVF